MRRARLHQAHHAVQQPTHIAPPYALLQGVISKATLEKAAHLRRQGVAFVIVTGARTSTLLQRLPHLPASDAYVSENGRFDHGALTS